jgi:divalent metal cation (Fe/Co/Zn/Cd) transporter
VNLAAAIVTLLALRMVTRPADAEFTFGHCQVEYFSSGFG